MVKCLLFVETRHLDGPFDRLARAAEPQRAGSVASDRHHPVVKLRCEAAVDVEFGEAGGLAPVQGRIVEKRKPHRALDLVGAVAGEKYRRRMGVEARDLAAAVGGGI